MADQCFGCFLKGPQIQEAKVKASHFKHRLGKYQNLINPNHRHDEEHERATDRKRAAIGESHRYKSFAPERDGNKIKWYVDGRNYFWALSVALERARETIYIADWWLSPELFLRRPPWVNQEWRIDRVLKRRAEAGVKIYVIVYKEVRRALTCNSAHTKHVLSTLCPKGSPGYGNIQVIRHPDHNVFEHAGDMTFYWAHHEKFVVIDYELAFVGGLDICFGRWDTHQHAMADVHPSDPRNEVFPGQDYNNNRIMDFSEVEDWENNELSKTDYGRMPWHDVAMGVIGDCVYDIAEHFVLKWNLVKRDKYKRDPMVEWLALEGREGRDEDLIGVQRPKHPVGEYRLHPVSPLSSKPIGKQGTVRAQVVRSSGDWSCGILVEHSIQNAYSDIIRKAEHYVYIENQFFTTGDQQSPIHNTIGRAIVDACVRAGKEGRKFRVIIIIPAIPGFAGDLRQGAAIGTRAIMDYQYKSLNCGKHSIMEQIAAQGIDPTNHIFVFNLRSYDRLNRNYAIAEQERKSGVKYWNIQHAIAAETMSHSSPHVTETDQRKNATINQETRTTLEDEARKFEAERGDVQSRETASSDSIAHNAMLHGGKVSEETWERDPELEKSNFVQEELYVHSKVLIADDKVVVCGSANINDRSQLGFRDSELAIVMEDTDLIDSTMDGKPHKAGRHATTLRRMLWREHLGLLPVQCLDGTQCPNAQPPNDSMNDNHEGPEYEFVADPLCKDLWQKWTDQATLNTNIYRYLFRADPDDNVKTFKQYNHFLPRGNIKQGHLQDPFMPVEEVKQKLNNIKGHLVWMPLEFLKDAEMAEPGLSINQFTESIYT